MVAIYFLYMLRCRHLRLYGLLEVAVGIVTAMLVVNQLTGADISRAIVLFLAQVGGLYVAVRGLDNIHRGLTGAARDAWERQFFGVRERV